MSSLYKRATPIQHQMLRIIEGAVKQTHDAHPHIVDIEQFARCVAKRAVGTLSAQMLDRFGGISVPLTKGEAMDVSVLPVAG